MDRAGNLCGTTFDGALGVAQYSSWLTRTPKKRKPELALRLSWVCRPVGEGRSIQLKQFAPQYASQAQNARTEQHDAAGLRSRSGASAGAGANRAGQRESF